MTVPSLRRRIRNGSLLMLLLVLGIGASALPQVYHLGGAIGRTLYGNYLSIESAQHMHRELDALEFAHKKGTLADALREHRAAFKRSLTEELKHTVEVGEAELAGDIESRGNHLFSLLEISPSDPDISHQFSQLHRRLDELIEMNRSAMFRAENGANRLSAHLTAEFAAGLIVLLAVGIALARTLAWKISAPLTELADRLHNFNLKSPSPKLGQQPLAELETVASEFNKMAERLTYEKSKTEAIVESLEDGVVLIDPQGVVTHLNEVAAVILGMEKKDAFGLRFNDLNSNHPHYLRVRNAVRSLMQTPSATQRTELDLHMRGRDHSFMLNLIKLEQHETPSLGTILILQDITYVRDQDRARTHLVATLSHELNTPVTSLALSAGLLERDKHRIDPKQQELVAAISEDVVRMRRLVGDLLDVARGSSRMITVRSLEIDLGQLVRSVSKTFQFRANEKRIKLSIDLAEQTANVYGDPVKISWALSNLIANALRYTPESGSVTISSETGGESIWLKISDTGPGIPAEFKDRLFERFSQWPIDGAEPGSAGLGLAIVKEIVEGHAGRIFVESALGVGTTFIIELPVRQGRTWQSF